MVRLITFISSITCIWSGISFSDRGPMPMAVTTTGELLYPISSAGDDMAVLSLGLMTFIVTALYTPVSAALKRPLKQLSYVYFANLTIFIFFVFLVSLDSSVIFAAQVGDPLPLLSVLIAFVPLPFLVVIYLTRLSKKDAAKSSAPFN